MRYTLTIDALQSVANIQKFGASTKDAQMTPILGSLSLTVDNGSLTVVATDRYRVAELTIPAPKDFGTPSASADLAEGYADGSASIPFALLDRAVTMFKGERSTTQPRVIIETTPADETHRPDTVTIRDLWDAHNMVSAPAQAGTFPPVARLFPESGTEVDFMAGTLLNFALFASVAALYLPGEKPTDAKQLPWAMSAKRSDNPTKSGPIQLTRRSTYDGASLRVLIQPCMPPRN
jgi:hypothetical protein